MSACGWTDRATARRSTGPAGIVSPVSYTDHGSNDLSNLWVEAGSIPNPKDSVENALHKWVCSGDSASVRQQRLTEAQKAIASDWLTALARLGASA